jgi:hypothetical protein
MNHLHPRRSAAHAAKSHATLNEIKTSSDIDLDVVMTTSDVTVLNRAIADVRVCMKYENNNTNMNIIEDCADVIATDDVNVYHKRAFVIAAITGGSDVYRDRMRARECDQTKFDLFVLYMTNEMNAMFVNMRTNRPAKLDMNGHMIEQYIMNMLNAYALTA